MIYVDDNKGAIYSEEWINLFCEEKRREMKSRCRAVEDQYSDLEEAKLSLKIAKINSKMNPNNKYYLEEEKRCEENLKKEKEKMNVGKKIIDK